MKIEICNKTYTLEQNISNLLDALSYIKKYQDQSLSFKSGCRSGICGSCAVVVNGVEQLSCKCNINDGDVIKPLNNRQVIKDLVVDTTHINKLLDIANAYLHINSDENIVDIDENKIDIVSNCILCNSCHSSCPVYSVNENFIGPFALTRAYRYIEDKKEADKQSIVNNIQQDGVFSCVLCGNCNMVCPAHIDIKGSIMSLQNKSVQFGFSNPNLFNDFNNGFDLGFNPNGF